MIKPANLTHAKQFEAVCMDIVEQWNKLDPVRRAQEKMMGSGYYQNVADAEWVLSTITASDQLNRDLFMEANDVIDTRTVG